jgi:CheY-like chemotaxis protein
MQGGKPRVLIVDDEVGFTRLLKLNLERESDCEVLCENDSAQAIETAHSFRPDVILLDIVMPGKDGGRVAQEIESDPELREVAVIFVTALLDREEGRGQVVMDRGGHEMLPKPVSVSRLKKSIARQIALIR